MKKIIILLSLFIFFFPIASQAEQVISLEKAIKKAFKKNTGFQTEVKALTDADIQYLESSAGIDFTQGGHDRTVIVHTVQGKNQIMGTCMEDTVIGKWGPIHYLVCVEPSGKVERIFVLSYEEIRGKPAAKRRFLKQYSGKTIKHPVRLKKDIQAVSGATITSRSLTNGVRKLLNYYELMK